MMTSEEGEERWENVQELRRVALEFDTQTLDDFLENVALVADQDTIKEDINAPTLLTLHAAKGLEFGAVFIVGLDDGILPHSRSFDEPEEMEEERRLFYVGITRAKDRLYLIRSVQRGGRGYAEETYPSRFLEDLPEDLIVGKSRSGRGLKTARPRHCGPLHPGRSRRLPLWRANSAPGRASSIRCGATALCSIAKCRMRMRLWMWYLKAWASKELAASLANLKAM